ncbi:SPOR domain-containing protein [Aurantiacibacter xanthus]|uniref:SPOR domain-containing protein n=1 Tax=Aurantiacibacter xanthus TaxID=1784712 RepID=A0A3A1P3M2_9SPHN|nr:SPOR domain-containing protein [Aurantiacibacter xanthus]RIV83286.1 SPOR domain-containing protein [Aurantiacibacter xanthus]
MTDKTSKTALRLGLASAIAAAMVSGCAGGPVAHGQASASRAGVSPQLAEANAAVAQAEAAVAGSPHDAALRLALGDAYLDAGRFASAETTFTDAMELGAASPRAALSLALAQIAQARYPEAAELLNTWGSEIATADLGLALALAGQPERGVHLMSNAIRSGENTVKMRQNLAYAFAMAGRWREARLMAQQDLPAGEVNTRLEEWAGLAHADAYQQRIASLLGVPVNSTDAGQPVELALSPARGTPQYAEVESFPAAIYDGAELAALGTVPALSSSASSRALAARAPAAETAATLAPEPMPVGHSPSTNFAAAFTDVQPGASIVQRATAGDSLNFVSTPVVQHVPVTAPTVPATARIAAPVAAPVAAAPAPATSRSASATHLVQLGSFTSEAGARRAWNVYLDRFPALSGHEMVITQAAVRGKRYWRVSAGGFDQSASTALCRDVRSAGAGCISWSAANPLPGAVN